MKKIAVILAAVLGLTTQSQAQPAFKAGEYLEMAILYRAALVPNIEVATVVFDTRADKVNGTSTYRVKAHGKVAPFFRSFFDINDTYYTWMDSASLRPMKYMADVQEGKYTFKNTTTFNWDSMRAQSTYTKSSLPDPVSKTLKLSSASYDAIALFFNLRSRSAESFAPGLPQYLSLVLEDTIRRIEYKFVGRETKTIKGTGTFKTLKFSIKLATSSGEAFKDGSELFLWISDDRNKIPLYVESPIRVGSVRVRLAKYENLKYPLDSKIK